MRNAQTWRTGRSRGLNMTGLIQTGQESHPFFSIVCYSIEDNLLRAWWQGSDWLIDWLIDSDGGHGIRKGVDEHSESWSHFPHFCSLSHTTHTLCNHTQNITHLSCTLPHLVTALPSKIVFCVDCYINTHGTSTIWSLALRELLLITACWLGAAW